MENSRWAPGGSYDPRRYYERSSRLIRRRSLGRPIPSSSSLASSSFLDYRDGDMTVCQYYQRGTCKFGDRCKNEHPGSQRDGGNAFGGGNRGGFNAFGGGDRYRPSGGNAFGANRSDTPRYGLSKSDIKIDLSDQRPIYPFSCYGPGRDAPRQLMEGPVEISPEELRARYYAQRASGNEVSAQQEETQLYSKTEEQVTSILNSLDAAIKYVEDGADVHPNRLDIAQGKVTPGASTAAASSTNSNPFSNASAGPFGGSQNSAQANPFGGGAQSQNSTFGKPANPFGQPSALGQTPSAFGQASSLGSGSGFGKPSMPGNAFGQASALGGGSAFGKPAALGGGSAFGQASSLGQGSAFGQPSAPGSTSTFGQASAPGTASAFGKPAFGQASAPSQPSAFGQTSTPSQPSAFGQASTPSQPSAFGQTNALGQGSAFGGAKPAFGQSAFGQPSQPGASAAAANPFAKAAQPSQTQMTSSSASPFATATQNTAATPAFGQPSAFAKPSPSPFAAASQTSTSTTAPNNPFAATIRKSAPAPAFGAPTQPGNAFTQQQAPAQSGFGQPAAAAGAAGATADPYKEGSPEEYEGEQGQRLLAIYQRVVQMGVFDAGEDIPMVPPKVDWVVPVALPAAPVAK